MPFKRRFNIGKVAKAAYRKQYFIKRRKAPKRPTVARPKLISPYKVSTNEWQLMRSAGFMQPFVLAALRYSEEIVLTSSLSGGYLGPTNQWALNGLYAVNMTGGSTAHQPMMFDQLAALYASYRVDYVDVEVVATTPGGTADMMVAVMAKSAQQTNTLQGNSVNSAREFNNVATADVSSSGSRTGRVRRRFWPYQVEGISKQKYNDDDLYQAVTTSNPGYTSSIEVGVGVSNPTVTSQDLTVRVQLTFYAKFWGPRNFGPS